MESQQDQASGRADDREPTMDALAEAPVRDDYDTPEKRVVAWNQWRKDNPQEEIDWPRADLQGAQLEAVNLQNANLSGANLRDAHLADANLQNAILIGADLQNASLAGAELQNARLISANLRDARLADAQLQNATLIGADLQNADLVRASFQDARLIEAQLQGARLLRTNLQKANLSGANLQDANLSYADLRNADLTEARGYRFDETSIRGSITPSSSREPWLVLRRSYTGPRLLLILFLLTFFLLPYVAKTLWWVGANRAETMVVQTLEKEGARLQEELGGDPIEIARSAEQLESLDDRDRLKVLVFEDATNYLKTLSQGWEEWKVWQLLLSVNKGPVYWSTAVLVLVYNAFRGLLTLRVSHLREQEELTGRSPPYRPRVGLDARLRSEERWRGKAKALLWWARGFRRSIIWLGWLHKAAMVLLIVAIGSGILHFWDWLQLPVLLPQ